MRRPLLLTFLTPLFIGLLPVDEAQAIPAWARRYAAACSMCHYPAVPRLNTVGNQFRWAGFRLPGEIGEDLDMEAIGNYISMRGRARYQYVKPEGKASANEFTLNDATFFYSGGFGPHYSAFFEVEFEDIDEVVVVAQFGGVWGDADSWAGFRVGQFHWLPRVGLGGFDRPSGISTPSPITGLLTTGVPFKLKEDQRGLEVFYVNGYNRISGMVLNGIDPRGDGNSGRDFDTDAKKDFAFVYQRILDDRASGLTAVVYRGFLDVPGADASVLELDFWRVAVTANKVFGPDFDILGGYFYGRDTLAPGFKSGGEIEGHGLFVGLEKYFPEQNVAVISRVDWMDPDRDVADDTKRLVMLGAVYNWGLPEYFRFAAEYRNIHAVATDHKFVAELMLNF